MSGPLLSQHSGCADLHVHAEPWGASRASVEGGWADGSGGHLGGNDVAIGHRDVEHLESELMLGRRQGRTRGNVG